MNHHHHRSNNSLPIIIIGLVLVFALVGGYFWYWSTATIKTNTSKTPNKATDEFAKIYQNGKPGAEPPWMLGSPTATVTVEEFADFQCPTCAAKYPITKEIINYYGSRIKFIHRNFPLQMHDKAYDAAVAAEAAGLQGKFWDMQNLLFTNQSTWSASTDFRGILLEYAQKLKLDVEKFKNDMAGLQTKTRVDRDMERGKSIRVNATPSFYVNGKPVDLPQMTVEGFKQIIDAELQKTQ